MARLIVVRGIDEGSTLELFGDSMVLGREGSTPLRLHDTEISRKHAVFECQGNLWRLRDLGSVNGTQVNGRTIQEVQLRPGDQIQMGKSVLVYSEPGQTVSQGDLAERIRLVSQKGKSEEIGTIVGRLGESISPLNPGHWAIADSINPAQDGEAQWLRTALTHLSVLYETSRAIGQFSHLEDLLDRILNLVYTTLGADRACILLDPQTDQLRPGEPPDPTRLVPRAVKNFANKAAPDAKGEALLVSRTLLDHVLTRREGLLVNDTTMDSRFQQAQSIVSNRVREILCVPMLGRHELVGVLYADRLAPEGASLANPIPGFTMEHLRVAGAIALQAALAVEESKHYDAMIQSERLAAVGQTMAGVSHHIKNILQGLKSGGEILSMGIGSKDWELVTQGWKIVERNQTKIYDLVMDMLGYSKEREPVRVPCDLEKIAREIVELESALAKERGIQLTLLPCLGMPMVEADSEGIHRALLNLVTNALDASQEADHPSVEVELGMEPGGMAILFVRDNGLGISPSETESIFRPFFSTKGSRGTGLGLPLSRKILREHGGDLTVLSEPGRQTEFRIKLPIRATGPVPGSIPKQSMTPATKVMPALIRPE